MTDKRRTVQDCFVCMWLMLFVNEECYIVLPLQFVKEITSDVKLSGTILRKLLKSPHKVRAESAD